MFPDESHIISCLINRQNHNVFFKGKQCSKTSYPVKVDFTDLHVNFIFEGTFF